MYARLTASTGPVRRRKTMLALVVITLLSLSALAQRGAGAGAANDEMSLIILAPNGERFIEMESGATFVPFGTNYYDPTTGWAPQIWKEFDAARVRQHFEVMRQLGVNCARMFLTAGSFQPTPDAVEEDALTKLDTVIGIARAAGIRLILTGPDHWEGIPDYWQPDRYAGEQALQALELFWDVVAKRYRGEPAILAFDLLNEPQMPWDVEQWRPLWNGWLQQRYGNLAALRAVWGPELQFVEQWGDIGPAEARAVSSSPKLRDWQFFREHLADEWVRRQAEIIRRADPFRLVTVGYIQWSYPLVRTGNPDLYSAFNPRRQVQWLDFVSVHFYPLLGEPFHSRTNWEANLAYLQAVLAYCHAGKPVVLGEYGWYGGGAPKGHPYLSEDQQARWISAEIEASRSLATGWLSWPFADSPDSTDMSLYGGMVGADMTMKVWARAFQQYASKLDGLCVALPQLPEFNFEQALTMSTSGLPRLQKLYAHSVRQAIFDAAQ